jgi:pimeloyl-ACP methyl ester carboxylesterase
LAAEASGDWLVIRYVGRGSGQTDDEAMHDVTLVGFPWGRRGCALSEHIQFAACEQAVFIARRFLLKTPDNPDGVDVDVFETIKKAIAADRLAFLSKFFSDFYNTDVLGGKLVSDQVVQFSWNVAAGASPKGSLDCVSAWLTDFRKDLARIKVPTLIIHGDADRILPLNATAIPMKKAIKGSKLMILEGAPHGLIWTHADQVNGELLGFLGQKR